MKVTSRITLGYAVLMGLLVLLAAVQIYAVRRVRAVGDEEARDSLQTALSSLSLMEERDLLEITAREFFARPDPDVRSEVELHSVSFARTLQDIQAGGGSEAEQKEIARLAEFWGEFSRNLAVATTGTPRSRIKVLPPELEEQLDRLQTQIRTVYGTSISAVRTRSEQSQAISRQWEHVSWSLAAGTVVLGGIIVILITRSIAVPLGDLAQGTKAMAEGKTYVRLNTSSQDELSQIAKDINTLADRAGKHP